MLEWDAITGARDARMASMAVVIAAWEMSTMMPRSLARLTTARPKSVRPLCSAAGSLRQDMGTAESPMSLWPLWVGPRYLVWCLTNKFN